MTNFRHKVIVDPVHGDIGISEVEQRIIDSPTFQRVRKLQQLGLASLVYPNATHSRFAHSLGVFHIVGRIIDLLVDRDIFDVEDKKKMRLAALLHDVGHYPYSHLMEYLDRDPFRHSYLSLDAGDGKEAVKRYPDHETVGKLAVVERQDIAEALTDSGFEPNEIAAIMCGEHEKIAYNQLIHSSLDMDRMDYMVRDSLATGVPYGQIDLHYLLANLDVTDQGTVCFSHKATSAVEHFLISRYFMYKSVYMHKTVFAFEAMMRSILFLLREHEILLRGGDEVRAHVLDADQFLAFHDGYVDNLIYEHATNGGIPEIQLLCRCMRLRRPPKMLREIAVLTDEQSDVEIAVFTKDRVRKINEFAEQFGLHKSQVIWEDPKDIKFESLSPFVSISNADSIDFDDASELVRIRQKNGEILNLVEQKSSILHHLSQLRFKMSRFYVVGIDDEQQLDEMRKFIGDWCHS